MDPAGIVQAEEIIFGRANLDQLRDVPSRFHSQNPFRRMQPRNAALRHLPSRTASGAPALHAVTSADVRTSPSAAFNTNTWMTMKTRAAAQERANTPFVTAVCVRLVVTLVAAELLVNRPLVPWPLSECLLLPRIESAPTRCTVAAGRHAYQHHRGGGRRPGPASHRTSWRYPVRPDMRRRPAYGRFRNSRITSRCSAASLVAAPGPSGSRPFVPSPPLGTRGASAPPCRPAGGRS
jgi:hypothetical protein